MEIFLVGHIKSWDLLLVLVTSLRTTEEWTVSGRRLLTLLYSFYYILVFTVNLTVCILYVLCAAEWTWINVSNTKLTDSTAVVRTWLWSGECYMGWERQLIYMYNTMHFEAHLKAFKFAWDVCIKHMHNKGTSVSGNFVPKTHKPPTGVRPWVQLPLDFGPPWI